MMLTLCCNTPAATGTATQTKSPEIFMRSQRSAKVNSLLVQRREPGQSDVLSKRRRGNRAPLPSAFSRLMGFLIKES